MSVLILVKVDRTRILSNIVDTVWGKEESRFIYKKMRRKEERMKIWEVRHGWTKQH